MKREARPYTRHDEVPVYEQREGVLNAAFYNHVQVALNRLSGPLRMAIPGLRTLDLILQRDAWVVVDHALGDLPVAAWSHFHRAESSALHVPVECRIRLYHAHAGMILQRVLEQMEGKLSEALKSENGKHSVLTFHKRDEE